MRNFDTLFRNELRALLISPSTYISAVVFLVLNGVMFVLTLSTYTAEPQEDPIMQTFFRGYMISTWFMVPLLTMRTLSDERRAGTLETLMTTPVSALEVVTSKFSAAYVIYLIFWALTFTFPYMVDLVVLDESISRYVFDKVALTGGYLFVGAGGFLFIAIGIFTSSLTRTQLVAGMLCFCILFIIIMVPLMLQELTSWLKWIEEPLEYFNFNRYLTDYTRGIVDTRPLFYFASLGILMIGLATLVVEAKNQT